MSPQSTLPQASAASQPPARGQTQRRAPSPGVLAVSFGLLALVVGLGLGLAHYSLWTDEATTGLLMRMPFQPFLSALSGQGAESEAADPLYYALLWIWARVAGDSEISLRTPSVLLGLASVVVLYRCLLELRIEKGLAWASAATFLALPVMQWYSLEARPYTLITLGVGVYILVSLRWLRIPSPLHVWLLSLLTVLVGLSYMVAGIGALMALWTLNLSRWRESPRQWRQPQYRWQIVLLAATTIGGVAVIIRSLEMFGGVGTSLGSRVALIPLNLRNDAYAVFELLFGRSTSFSVEEIRRLATGGGLLGFLRSNVESVLVAGFGTASALVIVVAAIRQIRPRAEASALLTLGPWLFTALLFGVYSIFPGFLAGRYLTGRHLLFVLPPLALLVAVGLARSSGAERVAAALAMWILGGVAFAGFAFDARYAKEDFRSVAHVVQGCGFQPDELFLLAYKPGFDYYGVSGIVGVPVGSTVGDVGGGAAFLRETVGNRPAMIVVDAARFDTAGAIEVTAGEVNAFRKQVPSLTMFSTSNLDTCLNR